MSTHYFGILLFELVTHQMPYADVAVYYIPAMVVKGEVGTKLSHKLYGLIAMLIHHKSI